MTGSEADITVRYMTLEDLDSIFFIDHEIRRRGQAVTYANLTTERVFTIDRHVGRLAKPVSYIDLIKGDVSELLALGLVAEVEGHVRGFILGQITHAGEAATEIGVIPILGVHPDYQQRGIAAHLVNALCEKYRSRGVRTLRISVDRRDKPLLDFVEHMGFGVGHLIDYSKSL
jgi:ribosomal protein S18 acetylase RimI-like enzyme